MNPMTNDDLMALVAKWRRNADSPRTTEYGQGTRDARYNCADELEAALASDQGQGWVVVPREPTVEMHNAAALDGLCGEAPTISQDGRIVWKCADPSAIYTAMIAAANPQTGEGHE